MILTQLIAAKRNLVFVGYFFALRAKNNLQKPEDCEIVIRHRVLMPLPTQRSAETRPFPIAYFVHNRQIAILSKP